MTAFMVIVIPLIIIFVVIYLIVAMFAFIGGLIDGSEGYYGNPFIAILAPVYNLGHRWAIGRPTRSEINYAKYVAKRGKRG